MASNDTDFATNVERFSGYADHYDRFRPQPPPVLLDILTQLAQASRPKLVVDLGCGTGLSTRFWVERAEHVIGVEPSADMRRRAVQETRADHVEYQDGLSHATGLPDQCADIVTCSQSLHWMEPQGTFVEAARILRRGGVFAAYDCDWPPTLPHWRAEAAYTAFIERIHAIERDHNLSDGLRRWGKAEHLARLAASGSFVFTKELLVHHEEPGSAARLIGLALSQGGVMTVLKHGFDESATGIDTFKTEVTRLLGEAPQPWYWSYRVRVGMV